MKKLYTTLVSFFSLFLCLAQQSLMPPPPPPSAYAEGCDDYENRYECTDAKFIEMAFEALSQSDTENVIKKTEKDIIFMNTIVSYDKEGQLIVEESSMKFHESELNHFEIDLSFSLEDLRLKPHAKSKPFRGLTGYLYLKIDRKNKKLIPLPNYEPERIPFSGPETYIVYPGCESKTTNEELQKCMSDNVVKHVAETFDTEMATKLDLTGIQRIFIVFKVNKEGAIEIVKTRAPHPRLSAEAERVVKLLPKMKPGEIENTPVSIRYTLPIVFRIQ